MSLDDLDEGALLAAAQRGLSPTPDQAAQVWHATRATLAGGAVAATSAKAAAPASLARAWLPNAIGALAIAAVSGFVGFQLGVRTSEQPAREELAAVVVAGPVPAPVAQPHEPIAMNPEPARPATPAARATARGTAPRVPAAEPGTRSMQEEIDAMRRIDRVLHEHDPRRALALLYELDRNVPSGKLMQEREAAFAMARCQLGLGSAEQLAADFSARYPGSVYQQRVRQTCTPDQRNRAEPETHD